MASLSSEATTLGAGECLVDDVTDNNCSSNSYRSSFVLTVMKASDKNRLQHKNHLRTLMFGRGHSHSS